MKTTKKEVLLNKFENLIHAVTKKITVNGVEQKDFVAIVDDNDHSKALNVVSPKYKIVQHRDAVEAVAHSFVSREVKAVPTKFNTWNNGSRMLVEFILPDHQVDIGNGDSVCCKVVVKNSHDSSMGFTVQFGAYRLICSNGLIIGEMFSKYTHKHTRGINLDSIDEVIGSGLKVYAEKMRKKFNIMIETQFSQIDAINHLDKMQEKKIVPIKHLDSIRALVNNPSKIIGNGAINTLWDYYNAVTQITTHDITSVDVAEKVAVTFDREIVKIAA